MENATYTVGQFAARCGTNAKTVQFYLEEGLLRARGGTTASGYRLFTDDDAADLRFIRSMRALGFSLDAIGKLMRGESDPQATAKMQLDIIDAQLRRLTRQRTIVASALEATSDAQVTDRTGGVPAFIAAQRLLLDALR